MELSEQQVACVCCTWSRPWLIIEICGDLEFFVWANAKYNLNPKLLLHGIEQ
jgi:hypothetical protein